MWDTMKAWRQFRLIICILVSIFLIAPMLVVVIVSFSSAAFLTFPPPGLSFRWYEKLFTSPYWLSTLATTISVTLPSSFLATALGTAAAVGLSRANFVGKSLISALLVAPIVVPLVIVGASLYLAFGIVDLNGSLLGLIIAHVVLTTPYVVTTVLAVLNTFDQRLEHASLTLGANMWTTFRRITLPIILPGVLSGFMFAVVTSFDELVVSTFISSPTVRPVAVQMWSDVRGDVDPTISAIGTMMFVISLAGLALSLYLGRSGLETTGFSKAVKADGEA